MGTQSGGRRHGAGETPREARALPDFLPERREGPRHTRSGPDASGEHWSGLPRATPSGQGREARGGTTEGETAVNLLRWLKSLVNRLQPPRFAKYRPAPRLGTRRLEHRI